MNGKEKNAPTRTVQPEFTSAEYAKLQRASAKSDRSLRMISKRGTMEYAERILKGEAQ